MEKRLRRVLCAILLWNTQTPIFDPPPLPSRCYNAFLFHLLLVVVLYGLAFKLSREASATFYLAAKVSDSEPVFAKHNVSRVETIRLHLVCTREAGECTF